MYRQVIDSYTGQLSDGIQFVATGTFIPNDDTLPAWRDYQTWLAAGNTPLPPV